MGVNVLASTVSGAIERLGLTYEEVGDIVDASPRSVARWTAGQVVPQRLNKQRLIELAYVADALAEVLPRDQANVWMFFAESVTGTPQACRPRARRRVPTRVGAHRRDGGGSVRVSDALDEGLVQRIDARGTIEWSETCYRYTGAHRDALSGEGARRFGGRWNPPLLFPAIYLADSAQACMVEVERAAQAASTTAEKMLEAAYRLHTIDVTDLAVLDLTTPQAREAVGLENDDIYGDDWSGCQAVGHAAWFLHMQGVLVPAAGGVGLVVTAYEQRTRPGQLQLRQSVDLTPALYQELRAT